MRALTSIGFVFLVFSLSTQASAPDSVEYYNSLKSTAFSEKASMAERWNALQEMGRQDLSWFKKDLEKALRSKDWFVRNAALISIQNGPKEFVVLWSERLLKDAALVVRTQAVKNLIAVRSHASSDLLFEALKSKTNFRGDYSLWIRPYLAQGLVLNPPKNWMECYKYMLNDSDRKVQQWAVIGLEKKSGIQLGQGKDPLETKTKKWLNYFGIRHI